MVGQLFLFEVITLELLLLLLSRGTMLKQTKIIRRTIVGVLDVQK